MSNEVIWITWERHRRSREMAAEFHADLVEIDGGRGVMRYAKCLWMTGRVLWRREPRVLFVQNPSMLLAAQAAFLKRWLGYRLIVDRHTNFYLGREKEMSLERILASRLGRYSLRVADVTIVTNEFLRSIVNDSGGCGAVLTDPIPKWLPAPVDGHPRTPVSVVAACSFAPDEPIAEIIEAAKLLDGTAVITMTGRSEQMPGIQDTAPPNVTFSGFIPDEEFLALMRGADIVLDLTKAEWCLVCGGYEAMALEKPFVTSATRALRGYYGERVVYATNTAEGIAGALLEAMKRLHALSQGMKALRVEKEAEWQAGFRSVCAKIGLTIEGPKPNG